ncbi:small nuclear ribonucleoprotein [Candidatus Pacearchaeota archaeon]|nr:small nuclear ribonucleoprotein [Candidatus Pacearchaeota archaeon]
MGIDRPLDLLNSLKGSSVIIERKGENSRPIEGRLIAFDIHINIVIETSEGNTFIRGDVIETVTPKK